MHDVAVVDGTAEIVIDDTEIYDCAVVILCITAVDDAVVGDGTIVIDLGVVDVDGAAVGDDDDAIVEKVPGVEGDGA
ncbi:MAG: hypothetical protein AUH84_04200 [Thaumarchaeota archaeon 13_1_40CM_4_38_7]|nr:MAG: hypothetical protein AUH84_04200 [Thaumarchaeota archaeon 13_1_40CM_4_38_7]